MGAIRDIVHHCSTLIGHEGCYSLSDRLKHATVTKYDCMAVAVLDRVWNSTHLFGTLGHSCPEFPWLWLRFGTLYNCAMLSNSPSSQLSLAKGAPPASLIGFENDSVTEFDSA